MKLPKLVVVGAGPSRQWKWPKLPEMMTLEMSGLARHLDCYHSYHFRHSTSASIVSVLALTVVPWGPATENFSNAQAVRRAGLILYTQSNVH